MSTKIYNGYKIRNLSMLEFKELVDDLNSKFVEIYKEKFFKLFSIHMVSFLDNLSILNEEYKNTKNSSKIEKELLDLYLKQEPIERVVNAYECNVDKKKDKENIFKEFQGFGGSCLYAFYNEVKNTALYREVSKSFASYSFNCEMCIYPMEDKILITPFGELDTYFSNICSSRKTIDKDFCKKYGLVYYGYWNNSDKPNNVTKKEWDLRMEDWNQVLKGIGIPIENGILIHIVHSESFLDNIFLDFKEKGKKYLKKFIPSLEERVSNIAIKKVEEIYLDKKKQEENIDSTDYTSIYEIKQEFKDKLGNKDEEIINTIILKENELKNILKPINIDTLKNSIFDYCPDYYKDNN